MQTGMTHFFEKVMVVATGEDMDRRVLLQAFNQGMGPRLVTESLPADSINHNRPGHSSMCLRLKWLWGSRRPESGQNPG